MITNPLDLIALGNNSLKSLSGFCLIAALVLIGCTASSQLSEELHLQSVLDQKTEKRSKPVYVPPQVAAQPLQQAPQAAAAVSAPNTTKTEIAYDPKELSLLNIPAGFNRLAETDPEYKNIHKFISVLLPEVASIWNSDESDALIAAGKVPLQKEKMLSFDEESFSKELEKLGEQYREFYQKAYDAETEYQVEKTRGIYVLKSRSRYANHGYARSDWRYIFFYSPEYRLNVILTGRDTDLEVHQVPLFGMIDEFKKQMAQQFQLGLKAKESA